MSSADFEREQRLREERLAPLQQRPEWLEWLSHHEEGLNVFFTEIVPDMPADPYTEDGARRADAAGLDLFPDEGSTVPDLAPQNRRVIDAFHRYIGELCVRNFEGRWVYDDLQGGDRPIPVVELPYATAQISPARTLSSLAFRRTGEQIAFVHRTQTRTHELWVEVGRPALPEWRKDFSDLRLRRLRES